MLYKHAQFWVGMSDLASESGCPVTGILISKTAIANLQKMIGPIQGKRDSDYVC